MVSGQKRWYIIVAYVPPSEMDGSTLDYITQAWETTGNHPWPVIMLGDFNVDFARPGGNSNEGAERRFEAAALVGTMGLQSIRSHYCSSKERLGRYWTWRQKRDGVVHGAEYDQILTTVMLEEPLPTVKSKYHVSILIIAC